MTGCRVRRSTALVPASIVVAGWAALLVCCGFDGAGSLETRSDAATTPDVASGADVATVDDGSSHEAGAPADAGGPETLDAGPPPPTFLSPSHPSGTLTYQRAIDWTIASVDPAAVIHHTIDGSTPSALSPTAVGKVTLVAVPDNTTIRWSVEPSATVHTFLVHVDATQSSTTQAFVDRVAFDATGSPVVKVAPGASIGAKGRASSWNSASSCPTCIDQLLVGIVLSEDCISSTNPNTFPGVTTTDAPFTVTAPTVPGTYKLKTGFTQQYKCMPDAIGKALGQTEIATIVVE